MLDGVGFNHVSGAKRLRAARVQHLFANVYEWAGELCTINIGKVGNRFTHYAQLESAAVQKVIEKS